MINITNKTECCGCNACGDVCGKQAITFNVDNEGFWYPEVDKEKCVDCHLCEKVCPILNSDNVDKGFETPKCFAAVHKNLEVRFDSTSGGLFSAFAEKILRNGGLVGGAIYTEDLNVKQVLISKKEELTLLRGSKYLQSDFNGFYITIREALKEGREVLVCGSPCQMTAVRTFLRKPYDKLYVLDYICRGIPSSKVFHGYLDYWSRKHGAKVTSFKFKIKELGWRKRTMKIGFADGKFEYDDCDSSLYDLGYHKTHAFCRPSCYDCKFLGTPRAADITLADFWGIEKITSRKDLDGDVGTSLVICNTEKGLSLLETIKNRLVIEEVPFEKAAKDNPALYTSHPAPSTDRDAFYEKLNEERFEDFIPDLINNADKNVRFLSKVKNVIRPFYKDAVIYREVLLGGIGSICKFIRYNKPAWHISNVGAIIPLSKVVLNIHKKAKIEVRKGRLLIGFKRIKGSKLESRILLEENARMIVDGNFTMYYGADVEVFKGGTLELGDGSGFNLNCSIVCADSIKIGKHVAIGRNVTIRDNNGGHVISMQGYKNSRPVVIEDHAWLCEGCTIMPGVTVGAGAIVGAGSIVFSNVPPNTMVSGSPAKIVETNVFWKA